MLPDDVLLALFDCYVKGNIDDDDDDDENVFDKDQAWRSLVHVCRRWRCIVFGSPRHLNLQLVCTERTRERDMLDVWPALPLAIWCYDNNPIGSVDNIIAMLEHRDRVCQIDLAFFQSPDLEFILAAMQQPFPELTRLLLHPAVKMGAPVTPDSFLGGSAPRLRYLNLRGVPFPGLPKLLLSATHLVTLRLFDIPHSGYISPDALVSALSASTSLSSFSLGFQSSSILP